jgi:hypothetical protein
LCLAGNNYQPKDDHAGADKQGNYQGELIGNREVLGCHANSSMRYALFDKRRYRFPHPFMYW